MLFDSHCHLDFESFEPDRAEVLARAAAAGVHHILVPGVRPATWSTMLELRARHPDAGLLFALGVHPQVVPDLDPAEREVAMDPERLAQAARDAGAVAIGECGLDGGTDDQDGQERVFRAHIRAARLAGLPLVVHLLRAHDQGPRLLREEGARDAGGVLHSYSGGAALVPIYRDLGFHFSLAGPVTYRRARRPVEAARAVDDDLLLAETDAPDQAPERYRGGRCEPAHLADVVSGLAEARSSTVEAIGALTTRNARRLFRV